MVPQAHRGVPEDSGIRARAIATSGRCLPGRWRTACGALGNARGKRAGEESASRARLCGTRFRSRPTRSFLDWKTSSAGCYIGRSMGERFGRKAVAAKMTDVPGHTWILPTLLRGGRDSLPPPGVQRLAPLRRTSRRFSSGKARMASRVRTMYSRGGYGTGLLPPPGLDAARSGLPCSTRTTTPGRRAQRWSSRSSNQCAKAPPAPR